MDYQRDPNQAPDSKFVGGALEALAPGASARLLDPRRTPVRVVTVEPAVGLFEVEVTAFEDAGARWRVPMELVARFQFARGGSAASPSLVAACRAAVERYSQPLEIACAPGAIADTAERLAELERQASAWISEHSRFFGAARALALRSEWGEPDLQADLEGWLSAHDLLDVEAAFTRAWVSNPWPAGPVEGHRIVAAELGLAPFRGTTVREPGLFAGRWSRQRRAEHLLRRMAFVRAALSRAGHSTLLLYRGLSTSGRLRPPEPRSFVSATGDRRVAEALFDARPAETGALLRQPVPVGRILMTWLETRAMTRPYQESEATLLAEPGNLAF